MSSSVRSSFFAACRAGDAAALGDLLETDPGLTRERTPEGSTGLHLAVEHIDAVRLLLAHGADPNARDAGDNASPLHFAGGAGGVEVVRALLDAGGDVHGEGDAHELGVIGWATCFGPTVRNDVLVLLLERGARHHIFSAIACNDLESMRQVVAEDPAALSRRLSRTENRQTPLHYVIAAPDGLLGGGFRTGSHYAMLDLLIELGADLDAMDDKGRTPLALAMLRGDEQAMRRLKAAGATEPAPRRGSQRDAPMSALAASITRVNAMIRVPNVRETVEWYRAVGFELDGAHQLDTEAAWAGMSFGGAYLMFVPGGTRETGREVSFWLMTDRVDDLYDALKQRQLERARSVLSGAAPEVPEARFTGDIHDTFYGQREFSIVDLNGYELNFAQPLTQ